MDCCSSTRFCRSDLIILIRGVHRAGTRPVPTKPDPERGRNPKPSPEPKVFGIVGFGIGRNRFVGIDRNRLVFSRFLARPDPSPPDPSPDPSSSRSESVCRYQNRASGGGRFCSALILIVNEMWQVNPTCLKLLPNLPKPLILPHTFCQKSRGLTAIAEAARPARSLGSLR